MINKVKIKNFKNISNSIINFKSNVTGIYGENGSGKTAVLEAINLAIKSLNSNQTFKQSDILKYFKQGTNEIIIEIDYSIEQYRFIFIKTFYNDDGVVSYQDKIKYSSNQKGTRLKDLYSYTNRLEESSDLNNLRMYTLKANSYKLTSPVVKLVSLNNNLYSILENELISVEDKMLVRQFSNISSLSFIDLQQQSINNMNFISVGLNYDVSNNSGFVALIQDECKYSRNDVDVITQTVEQINEVFKILTHGKELELEAYGKKVDENNIERFKLALFVINRDNNKINIEYESAGTVKLISILSAILNTVVNKNSIVLIDELDSHIYEYVLSKFIDSISKVARGQLIFTSHNLTILEHLHKNNILFSFEFEGNIKYESFKRVTSSENMRSKYIRTLSIGSKDIPYNEFDEIQLDIELQDMIDEL